MADRAEERRLAAILAADVVGYGRLMGEDEAGTLVALRKLRSELIEPGIANHKGRLFKAMGDGFLAEFASVVNAVACAAAIQKAMAARNAELPDGRQMELRIGVHLGDVIAEGSDVFGDGVNVAARIEALAPPGGVAISATVHDHIGNRLDLVFEDMGEQQLKNIAKPMRVYRLAATVRPTIQAKQPETSKPSIAVLPFTNMSGDVEQEYFSDGITEDIITELSRFRNLFVIARNSSFTYKGRAVDMRKAGRELGVSYVLEGSVRRAGNRVRITAQLIEAETGSSVWADRFDRDSLDIFTVQDELARAIASTVGIRIDTADRERAVRLSPAGLRAYDLHLRAKAAYLKFTRNDNAIARQQTLDAIALDPENAVIKAHHAHYCFVDYIMHWVVEPELSLETALAFAKQAITLDERDVTARWVISQIYMAKRSFAEARVQIEKAIELNPNDSWARGIYGNFLTYVEEPDRALEQFEIVRRYDPADLTWLPWHRGMALFTAELYQEAIEAFSQIHEPNHEIMYWLAASYAHLGQLREAQHKVREFMRLAERDMTDFPGQDPEKWTQYLSSTNFYKEQRGLNRLLEGLRKAGLPLGETRPASAQSSALNGS